MSIQIEVTMLQTSVLFSPLGCIENNIFFTCTFFKNHHIILIYLFSYLCVNTVVLCMILLGLQIGWLKQLKCTVSAFWRLEIQNQDVARLGFSWALWENDVLQVSLAYRQPTSCSCGILPVCMAVSTFPLCVKTAVVLD